MTNLLFAPPALGAVLSLTGVPGGSNKIHDRSPYGNAGTIIGATWVRLPSGLWCLSFDGSDDELTTGTFGDLGDVFTVMVWAKATATFTVCNHYQRDASNVEKGWTLYIHSGAYTLQINGDVTVRDSSPPVNPIDGNWHHFVGVKSGVDSYLYMDGEQTFSTGSAVTTDYHPNQPIRCGWYRNLYSGDTHKAGTLALVRIFNRPLYSVEIQDYFNLEKLLFGVW